MTKKAETKANKFQTYLKRQAERGLKQVTVWVPEGDVESTKKYAAKKRKAHAKG